MKLLSPNSELRAIYSICNNESISGFLMASLNEDFFYHTPCQKAYERIKKVLQSKGYILSWQDLITDPVLEEKHRKVLQDCKSKIVKGKDSAKQLITKLDTYRKLRAVTFMADEVLKAVKEDKVDVDELLNSAADSLSSAKSSAFMDECFIHIGAQNNANDLVKDILKGKSFRYIPTGFEAFDKVNRGLPVKSLVTIAGTSGGGKSTMAEQMMLNMSLWGAKCCYVPLEMDGAEMLQRLLSNISETEMTQFINADKDMSIDKKKGIYKKYKKLKAILRKKGAQMSIFNPPEDMTMEDILFLLKPYNYKVIFIDYVGLLKGVGGDDAWAKLGAAARTAKVFAGNNNCIVVLCAQLSEEGAIRYSKAIKEHSSAMFTWVYDETAKATNIVDVGMQKARNMKPINFPLYMDFAHMTVRDVTDSEKATFDAQAKSDSKTNRKSKAQDGLDPELYDDI